MTREEHYVKIKTLAEKNNRLLLKLPTGFGKTKISLDILKVWKDKPSLFGRFTNNRGKISVLIVIPKIVLIDNWIVEINKWYPDWKEWLTYSFVTYVSFPKERLNNYDVIILDECHHFTERCRIVVDENPFQNRGLIAMSGTVPKEPRERLYDAFSNLWSYNVSAREAIEDEILPDPTVFLVPLTLDDKTVCHLYVKNLNGKGEAVVNYADRFSYMKRKDIKVTVRCTEFQYYSLMQQDVDFWDNFFKRTQQPWARNKWLHLCGDRLKWLASIKTPLVQGIQS